jgi:AGCS family alanine or glycine:cation symporter
VWNLADVMNGMLAFPNLVGLLIMSPVVARETGEYLGRRAELR